MNISDAFKKILKKRNGKIIINVSPKDIDYALKVYSELLLICSRAPDCFFKNGHKECPIDFSLYSYYPMDVLKTLLKIEEEEPDILDKLLGAKNKKEEKKEKILPPDAPCPLLKVKEDLIEYDPGFFGEFQKLTEALCAGKTKLEISYERRVFLAFVLLAIIAFSRAARKTFYTPKETIEKLKVEKSQKKKKFYRETKKKLKSANPELYKIIKNSLKNFEVETPFKNSFYFLIRIFLAGFERPNSTFQKNEAKEIVKAVEDFLKEQRLKGGS